MQCAGAIYSNTEHLHSPTKIILYYHSYHLCYLGMQTMKSLLEKTIHIMPDYVLDKAPMPLPPSPKDLFANIHDLLPPPYTLPIKELSFDPVKDEEVQE